MFSHEPTRWKPLQQRSSLSWNQDHRSLKPYLISLSIRNARYKWKAVSISISSVENMKRDGNDWQALHSSSVRHSKEQKLSSLYGPSISWLRGRKFQKSMGLLYRCTQEMHTCAYVGGRGGGDYRDGIEQRKAERERFRAKTTRLCFYSLTKTSLKRRGDGVLKESPSLYRETDRK